MSGTDAFVATSRFGLGARPDELARVDGNPRSWLLDQLGPVRAPAALQGLPKSQAVLAEFLRARRTQDQEAKKRARKKNREIYVTEAVARTGAQIDSETSFRERLVAFWSNHFTVSVRRPEVAGIAGAFEREAIRPHVTSRFRDMLGAVIAHPAMLLYLDNAQSFGPQSRVGERRDRGLNENLAREVLELHTLGVDGGYTQDDVRAFAMMLTGWSVGRPQKPDAGRFAFYEMTHEPGPKTLLGTIYHEDGIHEVERALDALARHPATARHVARKLARHFIADDPPAEAVKRLTRVFRDSEGDLKAVAQALVRSPEPWAEPLTKVKTPGEFVVSALRAVAWKGEAKHLINSLRFLDQPPFSAPSPAGWPDTAEQWIAPESLMRRTEWALAVGRQAGRGVEPQRLLDWTIGPVADRDTVVAIERAPSAAEAIALLLSSPAFQRR